MTNDPTPAAAEARATKATEAQIEAVARAMWANQSADDDAADWDDVPGMQRALIRSAATKYLDAALSIPPEAKPVAAPSSGTGEHSDARLIRRIRWPNVDPAGLRALRNEAADRIETLLAENHGLRARVEVRGKDGEPLNLSAISAARTILTKDAAAAEARATKATEAMVEAAEIEIDGRLGEKEGHWPKMLYRDDVEAAINAALSVEGRGSPEAKDGAAPSPETGWRLVPVEATMGMFRALVGWAHNTPAAPTMALWAAGSFAEDYRALLAAAPAAPSPDLAALIEEARALPDKIGDIRCDVAGLDDDQQDDLATAQRVITALLKAQPNAGPSADGGKGGEG